MSHNAVRWALDQSNLKPAAKLVLICLADRHNSTTGKCFPSQNRLAKDACISRSSLNDQLNHLEALGYFTREKRTDPRTGHPLHTLYHLNVGFTPKTPDKEAEIVPVKAPSMSEIRTWDNAGTMSENQGTPCPKNANSHVRNSDNNPVRLTRKTNFTVAHECEPESMAAPQAEKQQVSEKKLSQDFWQNLLTVLGVDLQKPGKWWAKPRAEAHAVTWLDLGLSEDDILAVARRSRARYGHAPNGPKGLDAAMEAAAREPRAEAPASLTQILAFWTKNLNSNAYVAPSAISIRRADALISRGLVSPETLRSRGIAFTRMLDRRDHDDRMPARDLKTVQAG